MTRFVHYAIYSIYDRLWTLQLGQAALLLEHGGITLRPLAHQLAHNLAAGQLGHFVDESDTSLEMLVARYACCDPVLDVSGGNLLLLS